MILDFNSAVNYSIPNLNGGEGTIFAKVLPCEKGNIMNAVIPAGASIGMHKHEPDTDINFVVSGSGEAICDGVTEKLVPGVCHICPPGSSHTLINTGTEDLVILIADVN